MFSERADLKSGAVILEKLAKGRQLFHPRFTWFAFIYTRFHFWRQFAFPGDFPGNEHADHKQHRKDNPVNQVRMGTLFAKVTDEQSWNKGGEKRTGRR